MSARVSVAMATYNGERYLVSQLNSLAVQTQLPWELVIFDDGSRDETLSIATEFARSAPFPLRIFRNRERLGYSKNFLRAAQHCMGDLISFCDQDDIWSPTKLELVSKAFDDPDVLLTFHNARLIDKWGAPKGSVFKLAQTEKVYARLELQPWTMAPGLTQVIRRSLLNFCDLHDSSVDIFCPTDRMPHDQWFMFLASIFGRTAYLADELAYYRQHDSNTSGWLQAKRFAFVAHSVSHAHYYARATLAAIDNRIELLTSLRDRKVGSTVDAALEHHRHLRTYAERRMKLYSSKSLRTRTRSLLSLIKHGAYTRKTPRWGLDGLLLDICVGLPAGPILRARYKRDQSIAEMAAGFSRTPIDSPELQPGAPASGQTYGAIDMPIIALGLARHAQSK